MSTQPSLEVAKYVDQRTKDVVTGYLKEVQMLLPSDNVYFTIPDLIYYWIMLYCYQWEFLQQNGDGIELSPERTKAKVKFEPKSDYAAIVHGNVVINEETITYPGSKYVCVWEIKVIQFAKNKTFSIEIGLTNTQDNHKYYGFAHDGTIIASGIYMRYSSTHWEQGDIIKMKLNMVKDTNGTKGTVEFFINNVSHGSAFTVGPQIRFDDQQSYRLFIKMPSVNDQVELIKFGTE